MFGNPLRCCCHVKNISSNVFDISNNLKVLVVGIATQKASYSNKSGCKDPPQSQGKTIEPWPKPDPPPPMWRPDCPQDPQPPNYDPYRIKVPDVEVPPLPPGGAAKWTGVVLSTSGAGGRNDPPLQNQQGGCGGNPYQQGCGWGQENQDEEKDESFLGALKNWWLGKNKNERDQMIARDDLVQLQIHYLHEETKKV